MLVVISPAKILDFKTLPITKKHTLPVMMEEAGQVMASLKRLNAEKLAELLGLSPALAMQNYERTQLWQPDFSLENAKQAILAFNGEVFRGFDAKSLNESELLELQSKLRILSALFGVLKPLDLIRPYRLDMGLKLQCGDSKDFYAFWKKKITDEINNAIAGSESNVLVNLASNEYFKSIDRKKIIGKIVTPEFKNMKNGKYKSIVVYTKKARGMMSRFIFDNNILDEEDLQAFDLDGYVFSPRLSKPGNPVFTRG